jgi:hypothetical protein
MSFSRIRTLVTGGSGFIDSHLCEQLLADGHEVLCVDNFYTGRRQNIEHLLSNPRFEVMRCDITLPLYVEVDEIYNLACPASPMPLPVRSGADAEDQRAWRDQHAGSRQAHQSQDFSGLDQRELHPGARGKDHPGARLAPGVAGSIWRKMSLSRTGGRCLYRDEPPLCCPHLV